MKTQCSVLIGCLCTLSMALSAAAASSNRARRKTVQGNPMFKKYLSFIACILCASVFGIPGEAQSQSVDIDDTRVLRIFIFAGQSNMVGTHSSAEDVKHFPPFAGCGEIQPKIKYVYLIGRENMMRSEGWTKLQPVNNVVGPELSFAQRVSKELDAPIGIIKCASGGTHLAGDWNPDQPSGFKLYPLALKLVQDSLKALDDQNIKYRVEGFMWHQGENDMLTPEYKPHYAENLKNFIAKWRKDLHLPILRFYVGELCTKTVWGMDNRRNMYDLSLAQKQVCEEDDNAEYIPTNHVGVRTKSVDGLHYHYGTLGQLEHGHNYAAAYLSHIGKLKVVERPLEEWPYEKGGVVKLFVLAGHRNMEGEISFVEHLKESSAYRELAKEDQRVAYSYNLGGSYKTSNSWEPLGPAGMYETFGPELSFAANLQKEMGDNIAIAKFTHSGSQIIDWTPEGSDAKSRNLYPAFISFVQTQVQSLEAKGHKVELEGIFYHTGENDMSYGRYKTNAAGWLKRIVEQSRKDLRLDELKWFISQQPPTSYKNANETNVVAQLSEWSETDKNTIHVEALGLLKEDEHILMDAEGVVQLGLLLSNTYFESR